jgi:hypothetical protein
MLTDEEEIVVLVKQGAVESNQGLPLLAAGLIVRVGGQLRNHFYAFGLDHDQAFISLLGFDHQLVMGDWLCVWLREEEDMWAFGVGLMGGRSPNR